MLESARARFDAQRVGGADEPARCGGRCWPRASLLAGCRTEQTIVTPDPHLERMLDQPKAMPYGTTPLLPHGMAMQPPPDGTLPVDATARRSARLDRRGGRSVRHARVPVPSIARSSRRAARASRSFCATCHGVLGDGDQRRGREDGAAQAAEPARSPTSTDPAGRSLPRRSSGLRPDAVVRVQLSDARPGRSSPTSGRSSSRAARASSDLPPDVRERAREGGAMSSRRLVAASLRPRPRLGLVLLVVGLLVDPTPRVVRLPRRVDLRRRASRIGALLAADDGARDEGELDGRHAPPDGVGRGDVSRSSRSSSCPIAFGLDRIYPWAGHPRARRRAGARARAQARLAQHAVLRRPHGRSTSLVFCVVGALLRRVVDARTTCGRACALVRRMRALSGGGLPLVGAHAHLGVVRLDACRSQPRLVVDDLRPLLLRRRLRRRHRARLR